MDHSKQDRNKAMNINWDQQKVLSHPLRSRMVALFFEQPMTPKQMADLLGKNPGTVYYHIQQLLKHDLLIVEKIDTDKGIVEKYYRARAMTYKNTEAVKDPTLYDGKQTDVYLSKKLVEQLNQELSELFFKYGHLSFKEKDEAKQMPYSIEYLIKKTTEED
ncbi:DNA-binding transcriptional ArsR family regulator [Alkalihalobacillus xiaoxiensis]|uniref:DNA-binding transcriptional ArsR family regulator n=1 Tax=Shouchella xiaoxiensis TaxID=766895 RepID=A0ABS2SPX6_9BACI|nr:helix-turn-helix domain-containing protein [Shouchella xiaoxiensis]MBM7837056.1 DNA-binding transcriptional ArsR family regulator [Shouchella xiaoxiensis]